jgi:hypothetical protein
MDMSLSTGAELELEYYDARTGVCVAQCRQRVAAFTYEQVRAMLSSSDPEVQFGPLRSPQCYIRVVVRLPSGSQRMLIAPLIAGCAPPLENSVLDKPVAILRLPTLCANRLRKAGVRTVLELCQLSYDDLRRGKIKLIGVSGLRHIVEALAKHKLSLADYVEPT